MIEAELPDGTVLEFPDGTTPDVMKAAVMKMSGSQPAAQPEQSFGSKVSQQAGNLGAGLLRGAGSIGATLLAPWDKAQDMYYGDREKNLSGLISGKQPISRNDERRQSMDDALQTMGAQPDSLAYQGGKLGSEIAGTAGGGGLLAKGLSAIPGVASKAPALVDAIRTFGMSAGGKTGAAGLAARSAGGAVAGGASAGLVNPEDAAFGAGIGAVMPGVVQLAGKGGEKIGDTIQQKLAKQLQDYSRNAPKIETIKKAVEAGYVLPPNMVDPSFSNQVIESISGKQATQQIASRKNEEVTGNLVRDALGIPQDAPLTSGALDGIRKTAGKAYKDVADLSPQAAQELEQLKVARNEATGWFNAYNRSARPDDLAKAKEARALAESLEQSIEGAASQAGKSDLVDALRAARKQIAKTYTVGRALNDSAGTVDARVLGRMYEKGLPLSDGLDVAGRFGSAFPTVAKSSEQVGSPAAHNLKSMASVLMGAGGAAAAGPLGVAAAAVPFVAPAAARSLMFRKGAQEALVQQAPQASRASELAKLLMNPELQQLLLRAAPVAGAQAQ